MKKLTIIFLISIYLFSATDLKELLKVNVVIEHWHEHQQSDSRVSLTRFLVMHYITDDHNDKDDERDKQLPFKTPDLLIANTALIVICNKLIAFSAELFAIVEVKFIMKKDSFLMAYFPSIIWHPPQYFL